MATRPSKKAASGSRKASRPAAAAHAAPVKPVRTAMATATGASPTRSASAAAAAAAALASQPPPVGPATPLPLAKSSGGPTMSPRILLIDLSQRELQERQKLRSRLDRLDALDRTKANSGGLSTEQEQERKDIQKLLASDHPVDVFYQQVAATVARHPWPVLEKRGEFVLKFGLFESQYSASGSEHLGSHEQEIAFTCGLLELDNLTLATAADFVKKVTEAQGEYRQNIALFNAANHAFEHQFEVTLQSQIDKGLVDPDILKVLGQNSAGVQPIATTASSRGSGGGDSGGYSKPLMVSAASARNIAAVVRKLVNDNVSANDPWISSRLQSAYDMQTGVVAGAPPSALEIMLPDLEESVDIEIVTENLQAVQAIYFSYQLEEMRLFQVIERIVDLFRQGLLPLGRGSVGDYLFNYYKKAAERITEAERRDLYMRVFGAPGGNPANEPNRDFNELWLRFISAVSSFSRQLTVERLLRNAIPMAVSQEQVRKAGRDLGANLSRNGYGIAYFAATELQQSILEFRDVLQNPELRNAFGARDMWQVIDQVNVNYLGGARNTHRYRTQSRAGAIIIRWIANNVQRLANVVGPVIQVESIVNAQLQAASTGNNPTVDPSDWDLVNACEQWLAVGGVQDQSIEQYSQPIEAPTMTSRPIEMPQIAKDMLSGMGVGLNGSGLAGGLPAGLQ